MQLPGQREEGEVRIPLLTLVSIFVTSDESVPISPMDSSEEERGAIVP